MPLHRLALGLALALLAACGRDDLSEAPVDLGDFRLGLNIVYADKMQAVPITREATPEEWEAALTKAVQDRLGRYETTGTRFYNLAVAVDGYRLATPGIPIIASPKSVLVITVSIFDDATATLLNPDGKGQQFTIFEGASGETLVGSGLTKSREEQMETLAFNAARAIEYWLRENGHWFGLEAAPQPPPPGQR